MYRIIFYEDKKGNSPVLEYIEELAIRDDKEGNIKFGKVMDYIDKLRINGTRAGSNYVKHLDGEIWELRPMSDRILFGAWVENSFVLLHHFRKETQKTPRSEIEKAKNELADFKERNNLLEEI